MPLVWDLPPELEGLIFDAINITEVHIRESDHDCRLPNVLKRTSDVTKTLLACSSVCKLWRKYALERIFKIMRVRESYHGEALSQCRRSWHIDIKIETLDLGHVTKLTDVDIAGLYPGLKSVQSLIVSHPPQMYSLGSLVPNLRFLALTISTPLIRHELLRILSGIPALKVLHISGNSFYTTLKVDTLQPNPYLSNRLEEISISSLDRISDDCNCWLGLLQCSADSLRTVSIHRSYSAESLKAAFRCVGKSVRHLTITFGGAQLSIIRNLSPLCPNLTHATFDLLWFLAYHGMVLPILPSSLISIRLSMYSEWWPDNPSHYRGRDLKALADIFRTPVVTNYLTQLQELVLDIRNRDRGDSKCCENSEYFAGLKDELGELLRCTGIECRLVEYSAY